ncbi:MAG: AAA family ATPase [Planctomycetota bacterium]
MHDPVYVSQSQLVDFLLNVAVVRPVFVWGAPGIGKSALIARFADMVGIPCVSLLGSQLAPEDLIGVPQIVDGKSRFCPPTSIAREEPYCLFLDELNACSPEVQKAFYSLIHERRIGEYELPEGSIVIGAGNRAQDSAIVRPMSSALLNRMVHVHMKVVFGDWLQWAQGAGLHPWVLDFLQARPDCLWSRPPKHEEPFSTPRSWHMLSDALHEFQQPIAKALLEALSYGTLTPGHASQFLGFVSQLDSRHQLQAILRGEISWPGKAEQRDMLWFLVQSFRTHLLRELPQDEQALAGDSKQLAHRGKGLLEQLASISLEMAQIVIATEEGQDGEPKRELPAWFLREVVRDLPRIAKRREDP